MSLPRPNGLNIWHIYCTRPRKWLHRLRSIAPYTNKHSARENHNSASNTVFPNMVQSSRRRTRQDAARDEAKSLYLLGHTSRTQEARTTPVTEVARKRQLQSTSRLKHPAPTRSLVRGPDRNVREENSRNGIVREKARHTVNTSGSYWPFIGSTSDWTGCDACVACLIVSNMWKKALWLRDDTKIKTLTHLDVNYTRLFC